MNLSFFGHFKFARCPVRELQAHSRYLRSKPNKYVLCGIVDFTSCCDLSPRRERLREGAETAVRRPAWCGDDTDKLLD